MSRQVRTSVIVTTYKRVQFLPKCLEALANQTMDRTAYEVLVVDNNSGDETEAVLHEFKRSHPELNIRYLLEIVQGTSRARNSGINAARGDILCFTEDDAAPLPDWIENLITPLLDMDAGCAGGPIELDYQGQEKPMHLQGDLQGLIGGFHLPYTETTSVSAWTEFPWGGNMAFRRQAIEEAGFFSTRLGPSGKRRRTAEETELIQRVHNRGWKVLYVPAARVYHFVPPERLDKEHLYRVGLGLASSHVLLTSDPRLFMVLRWYASDAWYALRMFGKFLVALIRGKRLWFDDYMRFWMVAMRIPLRIRMSLERNSSNT